jgi:hypothetical protein
MKKLLTILLLTVSFAAKAQERIFSFAYAFNQVNSDSSNFAIQVDVNRTRGFTEGTGSYFFLNTRISPFSVPLKLYIKPTADINIGSGTGILPNNVAVGLPIGLTYKLRNTANGTFYFGPELSSDFVSDKNFDQYLYYFSPGFVLNYSIVPDKKATNIDFSAAIYRSYGQRMQDVKSGVKNRYAKTSIPISLAVSFWKNLAKDFHHFRFTALYKHNYVTDDNFALNPNVRNNFTNLKLDIFPIKQLGFSLGYVSGRDEPLFKQVKSFTVGLTLAR